VRVRRGADIYSDHYLVTACVKLKLHKVVPESQHHKQLDVTRLACPVTKQQFVLELRTRFSALTDTLEETDHDATNKWDTIKKTYVEVATKEEEPQGMANTGNMEKNCEAETTQNKDAEYQTSETPTTSPKSIERQRQGSEEECQE